MMMKETLTEIGGFASGDGQARTVHSAFEASIALEPAVIVSKLHPAAPASPGGGR
jgi:hypothetical protein